MPLAGFSPDLRLSGNHKIVRPFLISASKAKEQIRTVNDGLISPARRPTVLSCPAQQACPIQLISQLARPVPMSAREGARVPRWGEGAFCRLYTPPPLCIEATIRRA